MRPMLKNTRIRILLALVLFLVLDCLNDRAVAQSSLPEKVILVDDKVGESIDLPEKKHYGILTFVSSANFDSAQFIQLQDSSIIIRVWTNNGNQQDKPSSQYQLDVTRQVLQGKSRLPETAVVVPVAPEPATYQTATKPSVDLKLDRNIGPESTTLTVREVGGQPIKTYYHSNGENYYDWKLQPNNIEIQHKAAKFKARIKSITNRDYIEGNLLLANDSNFILAKRISYDTYQRHTSLLTTSIPLSDIESIGVKRKMRGLGVGIGALSGFAAGFLYANIVSAGSDFIGLSVAFYGGIGTLAGTLIGSLASVRVTYPILGSKNQYKKQEEQLRKFQLAR